LTLAEEIWYQIIEAIVSCPYEQDNYDVYCHPRIFRDLKDHPDGGLLNTTGILIISGRTFMIYKDCPQDFEWYVCKENSLVSPQHGTIKL